ncbi:Protein of unknown function [Bacillus cytotoxicus]|uniref:Uncharacterized protein n=1 Tax=Bacillus cytotoxicus TaxID=580165 RepID=A0AAX2CIU3_9BACI|nr:Protein of unknown function [Bacillus cytotoxicus]SCN39025.1 Protein of unknown function [Bacillus cytotoxicus]
MKIIFVLYNGKERTLKRDCSCKVQIFKEDARDVTFRNDGVQIERKTAMDDGIINVH